MIVILHVELMGIRYGWRLVALSETLELMSLGVDFFFVLSGFLITNLLLKEINHSHIRVGRFYLRRGLRILPLYLFFILCVFIIVPWAGLPVVEGLSIEENFNTQLALHLAFLPQVAKSFLSFLPYGGQLWSVGVEIMFYLLWPWLLAWRSTRRHVVAFILVCIGFKAVAVLSFSSDNPLCRFLAMSRFEVLAIGGLASIFYNRICTQDRCHDKWDYFFRYIFQSLYRWLGVLILLSVATVVSWYCFDDVVHIVSGLLFASLLLGSASGRLNLKSLENQIFKFLGEISYGIYVWHFIAIGITQIVVLRIGIVPQDAWFRFIFYSGTFLVTFLISAASYLVLEKPINQLRHRL